MPKVNANASFRLEASDAGLQIPKTQKTDILHCQLGRFALATGVSAR